MSENFESFPEFGGPVQQCVLPVVAKVANRIHPLGTGFVAYGNGLLVTAAHVLQAASDLAIRSRCKDGSYYNHYELYAIYVGDERGPDMSSSIGGLVPIDHVWAPKELDIGFAWLRLPTRIPDDLPLPLRQVRIRPGVPRIGAKVCAIGYYRMEGSFDDANPAIINYAQQTAVSKGIVQEVHPEYRDKGMLNFPCFRTDARFDHGMSGGPIFDETGNVVGVVCSGTTGLKSNSYTSYGSLVWPIFGCTIETASDSNSKPTATLLYDLAAEGHIKTDSTISLVTVQTMASGERRVSLAMPSGNQAV